MAICVHQELVGPEPELTCPFAGLHLGRRREKGPLELGLLLQLFEGIHRCQRPGFHPLREIRPIDDTHSRLDLHPASTPHPKYTLHTCFLDRGNDGSSSFDLIGIEIGIFPSGIEGADHGVRTVNQSSQRVGVIDVTRFHAQAFPCCNLLRMADNGETVCPRSSACLRMAAPTNPVAPSSATFMAYLSQVRVRRNGREAQPICAVSMEIEPPSTPSTGYVICSEFCRVASTYSRGR